jgi:transcriptional regulator with XRE-family HTH domain
MNLAQLVRALRSTFQESQPAFARRIGIGQSAVARLETGPHVPTLATLQRLADATGATLILAVRPGEPVAVGHDITGRAPLVAVVLADGTIDIGYGAHVIAETRENGPIGETMTCVS